MEGVNNMNERTRYYTKKTKYRIRPDNDKYAVDIMIFYQWKEINSCTSLEEAKEVINGKKAS